MKNIVSTLNKHASMMKGDKKYSIYYKKNNNNAKCYCKLL